jgi:hypothetical protein
MKTLKLWDCDLCCIHTQVVVCVHDIVYRRLKQLRVLQRPGTFTKDVQPCRDDTTKQNERKIYGLDGNSFYEAV